jgi:glycosyltransferase involved in cell wall biosynthesis
MILFYGAMVNLLYGAAKACNLSGLYVHYLPEESDNFAAHHPFWLDVCHEFTEEDSRMFKGSREEFLARLNWRKPEFICQDNSFSELADHCRSEANPIKKFIYRRFYSEQRVKRLCSTFQNYDCIFVCGANAVIDAYLSGRPYVIFVYGADLRLYLGACEPPEGFRERISYELYRVVLKDAYDNANAVISNPPFSVYASGARNITGCEKVFSHKAVYDIVYPVAPIDRECSLSVELSCDKINVLIPSRIDFFWKGQDVFLQALSDSPHRDRFRVCLLQWGNHQLEAQQLVSKLNLSDVVTFLPFFATRPLLLSLYDKFDLIVDEFYIGTYGTAALEAMSRRKPVVTFIDKKMFTNEDHIPPCLSLRTREELLDMFERICSGALSLNEIGVEAYEWQQRHGGAVEFTKNIREILRRVGIAPCGGHIES